MVLDKLPVPGRPTILITVGQGPIVLAVGAGGLDVLTLIYPFSSFSLSLGDGGGRVERRCWVNFQCPGVLLVWMIVGQGPIALAVGAGGGVWTFFLSSIFSFFFLPLFGRRPDINLNTVSKGR